MRWSRSSKRNSIAEKDRPKISEPSNSSSHSIYYQSHGSASNASINSSMTDNSHHHISISESKASLNSAATAAPTTQSEKLTGSTSMATISDKNHNNGSHSHLHQIDSHATTAVGEDQTSTMTRSLNSFNLNNGSTATKNRPFTYENYDASVIKTGWINKGSNITNFNNASSDSWKVYKAELKGPVLSLYKLPADLNIKSFDPSLDENGNPTTTTTTSVRQKRLSTMPSKSNLKSGIGSPVTQTATTNISSQSESSKNTRVKIKHLSDAYPHPELQLNSSNSIVSGSLESICHTVLFNILDDDKLSYNLLLILPLFGDIKTGLKYFYEFAVTFSNQRASRSSGKVLISANTDYAITQRLGLVVTTIIDSFPGMLLDESIYDLLLKLLSGIATHDEHLANRIRTSLTKKDEAMKTLTSFRRSPYDPKGSQTLMNVDMFLAIDSRELAQQINLIDLRFNRSWNPKSDPSLLYEIDGMSSPRLNPLIFNSTSNIHYLGRLIVNHLFGGAQDEQRRALVLEKWIDIGCIFDKIGDMVSWLAIATVICSIPVLRLKKTWSHVTERSLKIISSEWAPVVFELDRRNMISEASHRSSYHVIAPQGLGVTYPKEDVVPYFGDLTVKFVDNSTLKQCEKRVQRVKISFSRWDEYLDKLEQDDALSKPNDKRENTGLQKELYNLLSNHVSLPPLSLESVMELSLSVEDDAVSNYHKLHESRTPLLTGSYLPTLFSEIVPSYKLFNQNVLIGAGGFVTKATAGQNVEPQFQKVTGVEEVDMKSFALNSKLPSSKQNAFLKSVRDIFNIGSDVFHIDNDLIFKSLGDDFKHSRPASVVLETPSSKRLSQISNHRLSQLPQSNRASSHLDPGLGDRDDDVFAMLDSSNLLNSLTKPLNVVLKAGTFDKMIDVLVLTSNIFSKKIDKRDIDTYLEKSNLLDNQFLKLKMNNGVYTSTFFATYRSFASTSQLLEALLKRFNGARSAAMSIQKFNADSQGDLPDWDQNISIDDADLNWKFVGNIQIGVLEAVSILVSEHYADFTDDLKNKNLFVQLLRAIDNEIVVVWKEILQRFGSATELNTELNDIFFVLQNLYKKIRKSYIKKCYRPLDGFPRSPVKSPPLFNATLNDLKLPKDFREAEAFVNRLDTFINSYFNDVTISDWIMVFQLLEIHAGKSLVSLFRYNWPNTKDEGKLEVLNVFSWLRNLYGDNTQDMVISKFPPPVKALFELHDNLEKFFKVHIADPDTPRKDRNAKMVSVLQILTITRLRMSGADLFHNTSKFDAADNVSPHVPSFIETAIIQAIVSPESRAYDASWVFSSSAEVWGEVTDLLPNLDVDDLTEELRGPLTPCCGWFTERLMEIANFVPNMSIENSKLINFDKRRFTYNCVSNIADMHLQEPDPSQTDVLNREFGFLFQFADYPELDFKKIKDVASVESKELRTISKTPLFHSLIEREQEKVKRDIKKREVLENQERDLKRSQLMSQARASLNLSRDMHSPAPNDTQIEQRKGGRTGSSPSKASSGGMKRLGGLFKSVRPFSINVGSGWSGPDRVVHPSELPDVDQIDLAGKHSKPYQQIKLFRTKPLFVHSNIEGFFKLVGENGGDEYCFQAQSNAEAQKWIAALNMSKRYTYLSKDSQGLTSSKVFGVPIADVCEREGTLMPSIVERLLEEIELRGLDETGLYRVPGSVGSINLLKQAFDEGGDFTLEDDRWFEINTLAGCFKSYLRELPESLLTNELQPEFVQAAKEGDLTENLRTLVTQLPVNNYHLLKRLFEHLNKVIQHTDNNRMDAVNLAIVFSMSFINNDNIGASMGSDLGALQTIIQHLIKDPLSVFGDLGFSDVGSVYAN